MPRVPKLERELVKTAAWAKESVGSVGKFRHRHAEELMKSRRLEMDSENVIAGWPEWARNSDGWPEEDVGWPPLIGQSKAGRAGFFRRCHEFHRADPWQ